MVKEVLPATWAGAARALVHAYPHPAGEYAADFPCGLRSVYYKVKPRKGTVRVRAAVSGETCELSRAAFERSLAKPLEEK